MPRLEKCAAVIPCRNEEVAIGALVAALVDMVDMVDAVWVVDDGSIDQTMKRAEQAGARCLRNPRSPGKGSALAAGWEHLNGLGYEWALTLDGDGQHSPQDASGFLDAVRDGSSQLVVGNRMHDVGAMPWVRRWTNRWMSRRISRLVGQSFPDSQCGYRMLHLPSLSGMQWTVSHFEMESEVLLTFALKGLGIRFVPVRTIYRNEKSKIRPVEDAIRWLKWYRGARHRVALAGLAAQDFPAKSRTRVPCSIQAR